MGQENNTKDESTYSARNTRMLIHLDWFLYSSLQPEGMLNRWSLEEIQEKIRSSTGIKPRQTTILNRNSKFFDQYQCSPLRRVDHDQYVLDPVYFLIAGEKVRPPPSGPGRPRKKYMKNEKVLDYSI